MHVAYDDEYLELSGVYEKKFGEEFPVYVYGADESKRMIRACLAAGKPYDITSDPKFDPDADY